MEPAANERPLLGAGILLLGIVCVAVMDAAAKVASAQIPVWQITWARFCFHGLLLTPVAVWMLRRRTPVFAVDNRQWHRGRIHILRGLLLASSSVFYFFAIRDNPLPDTLAVFFIEPLLVIFMARFFLGERSDYRLYIAAVAGLIGVLIILRPGGGNYSWTILFALIAAFTFGGYLVTARFASFHTPAIITSWLTAIFGLLPMLPVFFFWTPVEDIKVWGLMIAVGVLSGIGHTLIILACRYARAAYIAILHYAEVGVATLISWWLFAHWPDVWVWIGVAVIAIANLYALFGGRKRQPPAC